MTSYVNWVGVRVEYGEATSGMKATGDGLVFNDPTETRNPTATAFIMGNRDFLNPTYAYQDDGQYSTLTLPQPNDYAMREWYDYGFNLPEGSNVISVKVLVKGYNEGDSPLFCYVKGGAIAWSHAHTVNLTPTEQTIEIEVGDHINTASLVNSIEVALHGINIGGGCFHPLTRFVTFDGKRFDLKLVSELTMQDKLLGIDRKTLAFHPTQVTYLKAHNGKWQMIRAYVLYPRSYINVTVTNPALKQLFGIRGDEKEILSDSCWTDDHLLFTRNKGYILAGQLEKGDMLGELFFDCGELQCGALPVIHIEKFLFEGTVYDVRCKDSWLFSKYLLGHMGKNTPE